MSNSYPEVYIDGVRYVPAEDEKPEPEPEFNAAAFFDEVRQNPFNGSLNQLQVDGINLIGATCRDAELLLTQTAYVFATVFHETARTMQPIEEYGKGRGKAYYPWYGRGHVQLTWEENYKKQQDKLECHPMRYEGVPYRVHDDKTLALHPDTSALICVLGMQDGDFTGKKLSDYITTSKKDYWNARRIVNGTDRAKMIAEYAEAFEHALLVGLGKEG